MNSILILGGTGIISSEVVNRAIDYGYDVTMINRGRRREFINTKAKLIKADLAEANQFRLSEELENYDCVVDFYSRATDDMRRCLDIIKNRISQYIFISSAVVYDNTEKRISEYDNIGNNQWEYATKKIDCEIFLKKQSEKLGIKYTIVRPYVTYNETRIPFQFAPMDYYTVVHRMKKCKPIVSFGDDVKCTLTSSAEFAVGLLGLILNDEAYDESFHITGNYETTWESVISKVANAFGVDCDIVKVPISIIMEQRRKHITVFDEILGDKGRNMVFDNSKIKKTVPQFKGERTFEEELVRIVDYYNNSSAVRKVDQYWEGIVDGFLLRSRLLNKEQRKRIKYYPSENRENSDFLKYCIGRIR